MTRTRAGIACTALALLLGLTAVQAQAATRRVLLLYSYEREFSHFTFARMFRPELTRSSPEPIDYIELSLQNMRASRAESDAAILDDLRGEIGSRPLDLVVTIGGPAASFTQKHRDQIFPQTPVLITAADSRFVQTDRLPDGEAAVTVRNDPSRMLESILRLLPDTKSIVVVVGASQHEQFWLHEVQKTFRPFEARVNFIWTSEMSFAKLLERCGSLPPHSAIFYAIYSLDANGAADGGSDARCAARRSQRPNVRPDQPPAQARDRRRSAAVDGRSRRDSAAPPSACCVGSPPPASRPHAARRNSDV
jgi:hypothetical protein